MKVIVTSGGTSEAIDSVRKITNQSTGTLGKIIAEQLLEAGYLVTLVTTKNAVKPVRHINLEIKLIEATADLAQVLEVEVPKHDAIVHAMAVSDYQPVVMLPIEDFKSKLSAMEDLQLLSNQDKKVSSKAETQVIVLKKTPKLISKIKAWQPEILLIGFKLLVGVSDEALISAAKKSLIDNQADFIFANDLENITADTHAGWLVGRNSLEKVTTREAIGQLIVSKIKQVSEEN
ncbi:MAG: phosphopantothenate--cysteine ligase [Streptococcaceae bacterium]|jgi:phosphopantothenate-cysteine ligase|nr:phosphopantothenate--cysteine ligase [Streptococcaceae bacterium]